MPANPRAAPVNKQADAIEKWKEYVEKIHYSEKYTDDKFEYRHVIIPKQLLKLIPKQYFNADDTGTLRLLTEEEWRGIGITQSLGWEHYEVHTPEPHVLLFRRAIGFQPAVQPQPIANGRPAAKNAVRK